MQNINNTYLKNLNNTFNTNNKKKNKLYEELK